MLALLSPAKRLNFDSPDSNQLGSYPLFSEQAYELAKVLEQFGLHELRRLIPISDKLLELNIERYKSFKLKPEDSSLRKAMYAFSGDTYVGLDSSSFSDEDTAFANESLRIISGLYGLLKPTDLIQPYRLEMGTKLKNRKGTNLYDFWKESVTQEVNRVISSHKEKLLINLASKEYFSVVDQNSLDIPILNVEFLEEKDGVTKAVSFFSKKARGAMANFIVKNKIENVDQIKTFNLRGYKFHEDLSSECKFVYFRKTQK